MAGHLRRIDKGDRSLVALPAFPLRNFTGRDLYVRKDGAVSTAADLRGKRVGMYDWVASGSIWYRHFLRFIGVPPEDLRWCIGPVDEPNITSHVYTLPDGVASAPTGRALSEMLIAGDLDAIYSPPRPRRYHPTEGPIGTGCSRIFGRSSGIISGRRGCSRPSILLCCGARRGRRTSGSRAR